METIPDLQQYYTTWTAKDLHKATTTEESPPLPTASPRVTMSVLREFGAPNLSGYRKRILKGVHISRGAHGYRQKLRYARQIQDPLYPDRNLRRKNHA